MHGRVYDLRCKEVVNICDGNRLGFVEDVNINLCNGCVTAIIVPCGGKLLGCLGKGEEHVIPWECIKKIGEDIILVDFECTPRQHTKSKDKHRWI